MRRLRESWLALGGSALIIALSVSSAFGAGSAQDTFDNIGEQVSEFARSLAPGQNKDADEPDAEEQPDLEEDEQLDEGDEVAVDTDEDTLGDDEGDEVDAANEEPEPGDEDFDWTSVSHGFCVSWHAHQDEADEENAPEDGEEWKNHGEFVSYWATVGCDTEDGDEADADAEDADAEEDSAAAKAERKAEREAARAERKAQREAAKAAREAARQENGNGNGRGRGGGGRP